MHLLGKETLQDFLNRFHSLDDAVIRGIEYRFLKAGNKRLIVMLSTQDSVAVGGWSNVGFVFDEVSELNLRDGNLALSVLSDGLHVAWFDGLIWCDFSPCVPEPDSIDEYRRSDFSVAAKTCTWKAEPYGDDFGG